MKIKTTITEINHEDLVNLLSTSSYGSDWLGFKKRKSDYYGTELEDENDCAEDTWAKLLLAGKNIFAYDYYAEGCTYGNLPNKIIGEDEVARYELTLKDITEGLERALSSDSYIKKYIFNWMNEEGCFDITEAEAIMQYIIFGEEVYG